MTRQNFERQALERFEEIGRKYNHPVFMGQRKYNRIQVSGNTYFQFGDLRVETETHFIVIEAESAGGITNLVKYWYCIENRPDVVNKPIILFHLYRQSSESDYGTHLILWDLMWSKMRNALGDAKIKATRHTYHVLEDLESVIKDFEECLKRNSFSLGG